MLLAWRWPNQNSGQANSCWRCYQLKGCSFGRHLGRVGADNTWTVTQANNVISVAVDKTRIQEKLTAGALPTGYGAEPIVTGSNTIKASRGEHGGTLDHTDNYVRVIGSPSADWISGLADAPHYIDTGPTELTIRNANSQTAAKFANASKEIRA